MKRIISLVLALVLCIGLIPLAGGIILLVYACTPSKEDNQWGPFPAA